MGVDHCEGVWIVIEGGKEGGHRCQGAKDVPSGERERGGGERRGGSGTELKPHTCA